ncbi:MAG: TlpA family protein disulfide reductase [Burkholderiaceae bacterium]|nr:TlpA family protein disulfide reductase [Burkholderiaceae bacterium]
MKPGRRVWIGAAALALGFGGFGAWVASRHYRLVTADNSAVDLLLGLAMPDAQGREVRLADWRGRPLVVNFWATWCPPCVGEMPELSEMQRDYAARGLQIVGIGIDSNKNIRQFAEKMPMSYPLLVAGTGGAELTRRFGNTSGSLPFTAVIDREGRIRHRILGRFDNAELRAAIAATL